MKASCKKCLMYHHKFYSLRGNFGTFGGVKLESLCNFSIVGCQWTLNCLLGVWTSLFGAWTLDFYVLKETVAQAIAILTILSLGGQILLLPPEPLI